MSPKAQLGLSGEYLSLCYFNAFFVTFKLPYDKLSSLKATFFIGLYFCAIILLEIFMIGSFSEISKFCKNSAN